MPWKEKVNIFYGLCNIYQRAIVVPIRKHWGINALGLPCFFAFLLQFFWSAFTQDPFMYGWLVLWTLCYLKRRGEAQKIRGQVQSYYDGFPGDANFWRCSEITAKRFLEPALVGALGAFLRWVYSENGWSPAGLPNFLLLGVIPLLLVAGVNQMMWERKIDAIRDAEIEGQSLARERREHYGDWR
jgi:hypothetical protein